MEATLKLLWVFLFLGGASIASELLPSGPPKVLTDGQSMKLTVVSLKGDQKTVLIQFENTETPLDGRVLLHKLETVSDSLYYVTEWEGKRHVPLEKSLVPGSTRFTFYPPKGEETILRFNQKESDLAKAEPVIERFFFRKSSNRFKGALQSFDRKEEMEREEEQLQKLAAQLNSSCGSQIPVAIDWKSIDDEALKSLEVGAACGAALNAVEQLCSSEQKQAVVKLVKKIKCIVGKEPSARISGGELTWTTAKESPDQEEVVRRTLAGKL